MFKENYKMTAVVLHQQQMEVQVVVIHPNQQQMEVQVVEIHPNQQQMEAQLIKKLHHRVIQMINLKQQLNQTLMVAQVISLQVEIVANLQVEIY